MNRRAFPLIAIIVQVAIFPLLYGTDYVVSSAADFATLPATLQAGDTVAIGPGTYTGVQKTFAGSGTAAQPIVIYASPLGGAKFEGTTYIRLNGSHITLAGLVFDGNGGGAIKEGIVRLEKNSSHCRVTNCKFKDFDAGIADSNWLFVYGFNNRVDHCSFEGKTSLNATVNFKPDPSSEGQPDTLRNHVFEYNYMGPRTLIGDNGYEGIRISDSTKQFYRMGVVVQHNLFFQTIKAAAAGEMEVISNKSRNNIYRYNTFRDNDGQLTLRHGDDCIVEGNYFFGSETGRDSGVRVIGQNHIVRNNYFERVRGTGLRAALVVMEGDSTWPVSDDSSGYEAADNAVIINNTFVDCARPINIGENKSDGVIPQDVRVINNLVQNTALTGTVLTLQYSTSLMEFAGNLVYQVGGSYGVTGVTGVTYGLNPLLATDPLLGYAIPAAGSPAINAGVADALIFDDLRGLSRTDGQNDIGAYEVGLAGIPIGYPIERSEVGPSFYGGPAGSFTPPGTGGGSPVFATTTLDAFPLGDFHAQAILVTGGAGPLLFAVSSGALPDGLSLSAGGALSGNAGALGDHIFSVSVTDSNDEVAVREFTLTVFDPDVIFIGTGTISYADWKTLNLGDVNAPDDGDDDGDGIITIFEFGMGLHPLVRNSTSHLPSMTSTPSGFQFAFRRYEAATGIRFRVVGSTDLAAWDADLFDSSTDATPNNAGQWFIIDDVTSGWAPAADRHFVRLSIDPLD